MTALAIVGEKVPPKAQQGSSGSQIVRPTIVCGLNIRCRPSALPNRLDRNAMNVEAMNDQNKKDNSQPTTETVTTEDEMSCLYLVVYDFQYSKESSLDVVKEPETDVVDVEVMDIPNFTEVIAGEIVVFVVCM